MTIGALPMACTEIGTEFDTATPFTLANSTLLALGGLSVPYAASSWVGKTLGFRTTATGTLNLGDEYYWGYAVSPLSDVFGSITDNTYKGYTIIGLFGRTYNDHYDWQIELALSGDSRTAIPSVTFLTQDWNMYGPYTGVYMSGLNYTYYGTAGATEPDPYPNTAISGLEMRWTPVE